MVGEDSGKTWWCRQWRTCTCITSSGTAHFIFIQGGGGAKREAVEGVGGGGQGRERERTRGEKGWPLRHLGHLEPVSRHQAACADADRRCSASRRDPLFLLMAAFGFGGTRYSFTSALPPLSLCAFVCYHCCSTTMVVQGMRSSTRILGVVFTHMGRLV